jgi:hypothetical protein
MHEVDGFLLGEVQAGGHGNGKVLREGNSGRS